VLHGSDGAHRDRWLAHATTSRIRAARHRSGYRPLAGHLADVDILTNVRFASQAVVPYTKIGLTPDGSSTWFLPRLIGLRRAKELFLLNRLLSADEAMAWGLVNRVVAPEELSATVDQVAKQLASGPTLAFASVKRLLLLTGGADLEQQMKHESVSIVQMSRSREGLAGVKAFKDKVEPSFVGS
jgi:enoyl-CoA hydratase/carnithine racemase